MKKSLAILASLLAIAAGCTKEDFQASVPVVAGGCIKTVSATIGNDTRASLNYDSRQQHWQSKDTISIYTKSCVNAKFGYAGNDGEYTGQFTSELGVNDTTVYYATYPYKVVKSLAFHSKGDSLFVEYPSRQTMGDNKLAEGANLMVAKSNVKGEDGEPVFYFQNACAYLDMTINGPDDDMIESIIIRSADGRAINGGASVVWIDGNPTVSFDGTGTDTNVILCNGGLQFGEPFDIAIPPFEGGFSVTVITSNGLEQTKTSDVTIGRNALIEMPAFEFSAAPACCKIGEDEFPSFKAAMKAADEAISDCTITLVGDCHIAGTATVKNEDHTVTIDLNGHKLTAVAGNNISVAENARGLVITDSDAAGTGAICQADKSSVCVSSYGTLTIEAGNFISEYAAVRINGGNFTMNGGTFKGESTTGVIIAKNPSTEYEIESITVNGGIINSDTGRGLYIDGCSNVTINDCRINTEKMSLYCETGSVEINGGAFVSNSNTIYISTNGYATINDCHAYTKSPTLGVLINKTDGHTNTYGGYFSKNIAAGAIADGYFASPCEETFEGLEYSFKIEKKSSVEATIKVGDKAPVERATVMEALKEAAGSNEDCYITLQSNCQMTEKLEIMSRNKITIDLNGFVLVSQGTSRLELIGEEDNVIVKSSVDGGAIEQNAAGSAVLNMTAGTFTLESGELRSANNATTMTCTISGGTININGGRIYGEYYRVIQAKGCTFNLNGGELANNNTTADKSGATAYYFYTGADLHFNGGKVSNVYLASDVAGIDFEGSETVTIDSLTIAYPTFEIKKGSFGPMVLITNSGLESNISGGTFTAAGNDVALSTSGNGTVNITGGEFIAEKGIALDIQKGTANVTGGKFTSRNMGIRTSTTANLGGSTEVNVAGEADSHVYALYLGSSAFGTSNAAFTISGGKYTSAWRGMHRYGGNFSITDGTFIAGEQVIAGGKAGSPLLEVWGGNFSTSCDTTDIFVGDNFKNGVVAGGRYSKAISEDFLKSGYGLIEETTTIEGITYTYKVAESAVGDAASVNGTPYATFTDAVAAANASNGTITLLRNNIFKEDAPITGNVTIDLAGYSIDAGASCFNVASGAQFTVTDGGETGTISAQGDYAIYTKGGKVIVNGGDIVNTKKDAIYADSGSTVEVNGGKVTAKDSSAIVLFQSEGTVSGTAEIKSSMNVQAAKAVQKTDAHLGTIAVIQSSLNVNGGSVINDGAIAIYSYGTATTPCTVNISGGEIKGVFHGIYAYFRSTVNVTGGYIESTYAKGAETSSSAAIYTNMKSDVAINISGGYIKGGSYNAIKSAGATSGKMFNITGGKYNITPVNDSNIKLPSGYSVKSITEGDYLFEVVKN